MELGIASGGKRGVRMESYLRKIETAPFLPVKAEMRNFQDSNPDRSGLLGDLCGYWLAAAAGFELILAF